MCKQNAVRDVESNEQHKQMNKTEPEAWTHGADRQLSEGRGRGGLDERRWRDESKNIYA